jgi:formylglycine-generating enzyme required for sulfatase activity
MGTNPSRNSRCGDDCPVEQVSWTDASEFIKKLNKIAGTSFRLPTEAEWEYACRSGGKEETFCGGNDLDIVGWYRENSGGGIRPVAGKKPNALGIYDMSGNVWEWVYDYWGEYPDSKVTNPTGAKYSTNSVRRGGSFMYDRDKSRSTWRSNGYTDDHAVDIGFRVALSAPSPQ